MLGHRVLSTQSLIVSSILLNDSGAERNGLEDCWYDFEALRATAPEVLTGKNIGDDVHPPRFMTSPIIVE